MSDARHVSLELPFETRTWRLQNGLVVTLMPRPALHQTYAMFATRYGSVDRAFRTDGQVHEMPDGIAHFLEHKMFEDPEMDVFARFAAHGASVDAYTTFDHTAYYFSGTGEIAKHVGTLLDFVQSIHLTDENVEKEKGIIAQEIHMVNDHPDRRAYMELLRAMYHEHPVRIDIAGTVESVRAITKEQLLLCYDTFYHPSNMVLVIAGGFDADEIAHVIEENQAKKSFKEPPAIERLYPEEPPTPARSRHWMHFPVQQPRLLVGWKEANGAFGSNLIEQDTAMTILLDALFGPTSAFYQSLLDEGLVDKGFSANYQLSNTFGYTLVGGNAPHPDVLAERIQSHLARVRERGIDEEAFERARKKIMGRVLMSLDQNAFLVRNWVTYFLRGAEAFAFADVIAVLQTMTLERANARFQEHLREDNMVVSAVVPS
ncbi:EF-P 5-aminopentanol modification-associated protein YfmH [Alicyclobacillus acidocaldarius]|uniref:Peptidase M16 domain protein n=1 Tax=Alicyclobacillus acidocaldarius subsp. acidocaldarius (strain ATCC 27009 / DSM 446 / BCRC 14685 / JCM 5260 / KCTC 1825 / NBRC 15652 / NCIMB 11725 / NRRL B-14509 / 104-IA) TaxID=521098 RepID=C8WVD6_ALIAD|nr:pitrilysin family protein [Alicyclobacillus acidocaldarius]ACV58058.1 peptidase M16 domain protein [Alicyclobacillus acidocaldarius subsp. acidocaldarius DSM 446]